VPGSHILHETGFGGCPGMVGPAFCHEKYVMFERMQAVGVVNIFRATILNLHGIVIGAIGT
jgi:hypothetical protein